MESTLDLSTLDDLVALAEDFPSPPKLPGDGKLFESVAVHNRGLVIDVRSLTTGAIVWRLHPDLYCEIAGIERSELDRRIEAGEVRSEVEAVF